MMISSSSSCERRLRWRWVAWRTGPIVILVAAVAAWFALVPWIPFFPQPLGRHLTEWFLRGLLVGYAAALATASLGASAWRCMCFGGVGGGCGGRSRRGSGCSVRRA